MREYDLSTARWRKSSYSDQNGGNCVEVADNLSVVPVRDSKTPHGPALVFPAAGWTTFVDAVKNAHFADA
ncbi:DUF397 domain-containing protein [Streptomyces platensis]|uniref:DUF397 domain-containing protein n=1 Tax=Streptomyces platensis TaxID=58346 RepID=UPI001F234BA7|nr:DUF397 domain-containing protein [Streptomyces platensis]MCF3143427.1 DUF397 domain-containing protein [Streptomyces platensis]